MTKRDVKKQTALTFRDKKFNREKFFEDFISKYEIGKTFQDVTSYLNELDVEMTDDVQQSFKHSPCYPKPCHSDLQHRTRGDSDGATGRSGNAA